MHPVHTINLISSYLTEKSKSMQLTDGFTYRTKACETLLEEIGFDRVNALNDDVQTDVELFVLNQKRVLNVSLHQIFMMVCIAW